MFGVAWHQLVKGDAVLSGEERRALEEIEHDVTASDPKLAARLKRGKFRRTRWLLYLALAAWVSLPLTAALGWWPITIAMLVPVLLLATAALISEHRQD